jgi:hypothetical protein
MAEETRYGRNPGVTETIVDSEIFLVDPDTQEVFYLDEAGTALWRLIDAPQSFDEVLAVYSAAFPDIDPGRIETDLKASLDKLLEPGLVVAF